MWRCDAPTFILDALDPMTDAGLAAAADALAEGLLALNPGAAVHRRLLPTPDGDPTC